MKTQIVCSYLRLRRLDFVSFFLNENKKLCTTAKNVSDNLCIIVFMDLSFFCKMLHFVYLHSRHLCSNMRERERVFIIQGIILYTRKSTVPHIHLKSLNAIYMYIILIVVLKLSVRQLLILIVYSTTQFYERVLSIFWTRYDYYIHTRIYTLLHMSSL